MSLQVGRRAMILAAGLGLRMRPLTETVPKPLVELAGKPLIAYALDRLKGASVEQVVVNVHWLPEQVESWARAQAAPEILISDERDELLETGGGVAKALPLLGDAPFFVLNSDSTWIEGAKPALERMREAWRPAVMDGLLLVCPTAHTVGYCGQGDFHLEPEGRLVRRAPGQVAPFVFAGCYLAAPQLFASAPEGPFSMNVLWDRALAAGRLHGLRHDGVWLHVGTPDAIAPAERAFADIR
jgi:N-acetyl-alpha-D-muramate 1-phosphate uridylyltransferase